ncbi:22564_t:CDS:2 [Gigaspora margarita]|uniref:22564_t:CDS:1 n=1 Tax=Gigaspora margarita TaxID=4874 RepID=A0ABN7UYF3_GIGMA|nr:22564_t:CDS:2 [Gigaspora margarita]
MSKKRVKVSGTNVDANNMMKGVVIINSNKKEVSENNERTEW